MAIMLSMVGGIANALTLTHDMPSASRNFYALTQFGVPGTVTGNYKLWASTDGILDVEVCVTGAAPFATATSDAWRRSRVQIDLAPNRQCSISQVKRVVITPGNMQVGTVAYDGSFQSVNIDPGSVSFTTSGNTQVFRITLSIVRVVGVPFKSRASVACDMHVITAAGTLSMSTNMPDGNPTHFVDLSKAPVATTLQAAINSPAGTQGCVRGVITALTATGGAVLEDPFEPAATLVSNPTQTPLVTGNFITADITVRDWKLLQIDSIRDQCQYGMPKPVGMNGAAIRRRDSLTGGPDTQYLRVQIPGKVTSGRLSDGRTNVVLIGNPAPVDGYCMVTGIAMFDADSPALMVQEVTY